MVQGDHQNLIAGPDQGLPDHGVALGDIGLGLHGIGQAVHHRVADLAEVEVAISPRGARADQRLQRVLSVVGSHTPAEKIDGRVETLHLLNEGGHVFCRQLRLHANAGPHGHHCLADFLVVDVAIVRTVKACLEPVRVAGVDQKLLGRVDVGRCGPVQCRIVAIDPRRHDQSCGYGEPPHGASLDGGAVDGQRQGLTYTLVGKRVLALHVAVL